MLLQALSNPKGPAGACFQAAKQGRVDLCISIDLIAELADVVARPIVVQKLRLSGTAGADFLAELGSVSATINPIAEVYQHPIDPKDTMIVNLALAASASVIVSRDKHLLALDDPAHPEGAVFLAKFGSIAVLTPVELLDRLRAV